MLRKAELSDVESISYIHVKAWQETYKDLLTENTISKFHLESRKQMWRAFFERSADSQGVYVASYNDQLIGFASWHDKSDDVELTSLYILKDFQCRGIGKALFKVIEKIAIDKRKPLITWVLKGSNAAQFYEKMGLKLIKSEDKTLAGSDVCELLYSNSDQTSVTN